MGKVYDSIMQLTEVDEFKAVISKWHKLSSNLVTFPTDVPILLPDMFWNSHMGVENERFLYLMSQYLLEEGNLMYFSGGRNWVELELKYCSPQDTFTGIRKLNDVINSVLECDISYCGIVYIDITAWLGHCEESHFIDFMKYLSVNSNDWLVVLNVLGARSKESILTDEVRKMEAFVSMFLRLECITLTMPKTESLCEYVAKFMAKYGLSFDAEGRLLIYESLERLRSSEYFCGFATATMLCRDIIYQLYTTDKVEMILTAEALAAFSADSEYVMRAMVNFEQTCKIGI